MRNDILKLFILIVAMQGFISCSKQLDLTSDGRLTLNDIFNEYYRTKNYYTQCYSYIPAVGFSYGNSPLASFSDEAHDASNGVSGPVNDWYNNRTSAFNNPLGGYWAQFFDGIRKCNTFLQNINNPQIATATIDPEEKTGWIAEVHVLRAFYYLQLIKRYGGVPIMDAPYELTHDYSQDQRATFEECVDFIIADCDSALAVPESTRPTVGFRWNVGDDEKTIFTRAVAYAVKSQAALYAASPLWYQGGKYTWEKAAQITKESLDQCLAHGLELFNITPPSDVAQNAYAYYFIRPSDASHSVDKETIYESPVRANVWSLAGLPFTEGAIKAGAGPSQELVDAYEMQATGELPVLGYSDAAHLQPIINPASGYDPENPYKGRDPRFYASIYYNGAPSSLDAGGGTPVETFVGGNAGISSDITQTRFTRTGYYMRKFNNYKSSANLPDGDGFMRIFRLGELYLNYAEAAAEAGNDAEARIAVNAIRARAGMPDLPATLSGNDLISRIRNERRVELAFEEHRFFDVRRWKILNETDGFVTGMKITKNANNGTYSYQRIKLQNRGTDADKYLLLPISQSEVAKMENATGDNWQNPGW